MPYRMRFHGGGSGSGIFDWTRHSNSNSNFQFEFGLESLLKSYICIRPLTCLIFSSVRCSRPAHRQKQNEAFLIPGQILDFLDKSNLAYIIKETWLVIASAQDIYPMVLLKVGFQ
jgi:hypothetical protein